MKLLAIDASTEACSVAIQLDNEIFSDFQLCPQSHSVVLLPMVDKLLHQADCKLTDFDVLVYGRGPGSFTGVRIGIGVAQGLAFAADLPTVGISTMQAMAQQAFEVEHQHDVSVAIDARMSEVYCANYELAESGIMTLRGEERVMPPQAFAEHLGEGTNVYGAGTGWQSYQEQLAGLASNSEDITILYPHAKYMLGCARRHVADGDTQPAELAQPVYVRDTVSWKKLPGRE
ncbi:tRNA (adenosine(37)-N6)-threonylcarbamoyltransferase complex dimerization subunit type 1 TsaB [Thalassotalea euphylliae]|uniref:tRNA (adenosine(37)-N6)-threonylcarbamoyltransferase complex dimerization subunit type 1 TsaB n=1 Tax=Thalassotalea euphylliae TaxID=1655234 RepID=UPI00364227BA